MHVWSDESHSDESIQTFRETYVGVNYEVDNIGQEIEDQKNHWHGAQNCDQAEFDCGIEYRIERVKS